MFHFEWPFFALLLPLPLILIKTFKRKLLESDSPPLYFPALKRLKQAFQGFSIVGNGSKKLFFTLLFLAWCFLILALMQPEEVERYTRSKIAGHDLMLAVDTSGSMQAADFSTSGKLVTRLDTTKEVVGQFVRGREGDRVGLITFGEHAYLHVPLTSDTLSVAKSLQDTASGMAGNATAIGDAIGLGVKSLKNRPEGSRAIILLTDGEDNASKISPIEAAKLAKEFGIRIYTIGIGKEGPVPYPTPSGHTVMVEIPIDEALLKEIAEITGGEYFKATDKHSLQSIYQKIDALEKTEADQTLFLLREPLYLIPLSLSMGSILCLLLMTLLKPLFRKTHV